MKNMIIFINKVKKNKMINENRFLILKLNIFKFKKSKITIKLKKFNKSKILQLCLNLKL